jgi:hypothetical protein
MKRRVKRWGILVLVSLSCLGCIKLGEEWYSIDIYNNSAFPIYSYAVYNTDSLPVEKPELKLIRPKKARAYRDYELDDKEFNRLENGESITVFIFSQDTVDKNGWSYVYENSKILKIYIVTRASLHDVIYYPSK